MQPLHLCDYVTFVETSVLPCRNNVTEMGWGHPLQGNQITENSTAWRIALFPPPNTLPPFFASISLLQGFPRNNRGWFPLSLFIPITTLLVPPSTSLMTRTPRLFQQGVWGYISHALVYLRPLCRPQCGGWFPHLTIFTLSQIAKIVSIPYAAWIFTPSHPDRHRFFSRNIR